MDPIESKPWTNERLYFDGDEYFSDLLSEIARARVSIDLESYIFMRDALGERILWALRHAAERGVRVRLVVDGIGSPGFNSKRVRFLNSQGILTRVYHPLPWVFPLPASRFARFIKTRRIFNRIYLLNRRDHRKLCIIDGKSAWLGSLNVDARHLREFHGDRAWHDIGVRVEGPAIPELADAFTYAWKRASGLKLPSVARLKRFFRIPTMRRLSRMYSSAIRLNTTERKRRGQYHELLDEISASRGRVWIATAYFAPEIQLMRALRKAALGGADVRVLLPHQSDVFFMPWVTEAFYSRLLLGGIRIFEYLPSFLHAKAMIVDDRVLIGSSNLNHRSLLHDLELDVLLESPRAIGLLEKHFNRDFEHAREIRLPSWKRLPLAQRIAGRVFLFFKYWL